MLEERDLYLDKYHSIRIVDSREENLRDVADDYKKRSNITAPRCNFYMKEGKGLIKRDCLVYIPHLKRGVIFGLV